jgi:probable phosphoglycerate mutase
VEKEEVNATSNMLQRLYLIRHGETAWSLSGQHTGRTDIPLTARGEQDARELADRLRAMKFNHVFTSPLQRARRTCDLAGLGSSAEIERDLQEWNYGDYEGQRSMDIRGQRPDWNLFRDGCPNGESPSQICQRADRVIARLRTLEGNIAIFSHGHFGRVLAARWMGLPVAQAQHLLLSTASLSILGYEHNRVEEPAIVLWNAGLNGISDMVPTQRVPHKEALARKRAIERWENEGGQILPESKTTGNPLPDSESTAADRGIIKIHVRKLDQLFDSLDHSPFREKDLDRNAEEYIVDSMKEFPARAPCELVIYLDQPAGVREECNFIAEAIHVHFARRAQVLRQHLRQLLRRGSISLVIGLSFLVTIFLLGQLARGIMGETQWAFVLRESLLIGGWVAMWKPLEIFLYDWWPIVGERRLYDRLSRIQVRIIQADSRATADTSSMSLRN